MVDEREHRSARAAPRRIFIAERPAAPTVPDPECDPKFRGSRFRNTPTGPVMVRPHACGLRKRPTMLRLRAGCFGQCRVDRVATDQKVRGSNPSGALGDQTDDSPATSGNAVGGLLVSGWWTRFGSLGDPKCDPKCRAGSCPVGSGREARDAGDRMVRRLRRPARPGVKGHWFLPRGGREPARSRMVSVAAMSMSGRAGWSGAVPGACYSTLARRVRVSRVRRAHRSSRRVRRSP